MDNQNRDEPKQAVDPKTLLHPPPNHNPLIGLLQGDTLVNVHDSLSTLQELSVSRSDGELNLSPASSTGLFFLMDCIIDALRFEIDHRDQLERAVEVEKRINETDG